MRAVAAVAAVIGLISAGVSAKRACPAEQLPCSPTCDSAHAKRHCRYCKCKACAMCGTASAQEGRVSGNSNKQKPRRHRNRLRIGGKILGRKRLFVEGRPQLGGSRIWTPTEPEATSWGNVSAASNVLRLLGYVPGSHMPLEFGGDAADYSLKGTHFERLAAVEAASAGPRPLSLRGQRQQAAHGLRKRSDVSWHASPVAGLLQRKSARPPTPRKRARKHKKHLFGHKRSRAVTSDRTANSYKNLTLAFTSRESKASRQRKKSSNRPVLQFTGKRSVKPKRLRLGNAGSNTSRVSRSRSRNKLVRPSPKGKGKTKRKRSTRITKLPVSANEPQDDSDSQHTFT